MAVFFVTPLVENGVRGFYPSETSGFSLAIYQKFVSDPFYLGVLARTVGLSLVVTLIALVIGYPVAYFMVRQAGRWSGLVVFLLIAPLLTSIVMRTFGWRVLLARRGLVNVWLGDLGLIDTPLDLLNGPGVAITGLVHVLVPFMVLAIAAALQGVDVRLEECARILGAGRIAAFLRVTLPLSLDGVGTGSILVFMLANGSFVTLLLLGRGLQTLPLLIYQQVSTTRDFAFAAVMSNILLATAILCLFLQLRLIRRKAARR